MGPDEAEENRKAWFFASCDIRNLDPAAVAAALELRAETTGMPLFYEAWRIDYQAAEQLVMDLSLAVRAGKIRFERVPERAPPPPPPRLPSPGESEQVAAARQRGPQEALQPRPPAAEGGGGVGGAPKPPKRAQATSPGISVAEASGGSRAVSPTLPPPPPGVATKDQSDALFKELAARMDIPFDYPVDCCYARAHVMSRQAESKGVTTKKLWYFDKDWGTQEVHASLHPTKPDGTSVTFPDETGTERPVQWVYHVAPLIKVQQEDGSIQESVLDPSVSDRPLSKAEWKAIQGTPSGAYEEVTDSDAYFSNKKHGIRQEDPSLSTAQDQLTKHKMDRDAARAAVRRNNGASR